MEGKLFKMVEGYTLSLTGSIDDLYGISDKQLAEDHQLHKLSLKNCESIANGYDLDELVKEQYPIDEPSFKRGFKLALEILGDKKFSEEDMIEFAKWTFLEVGSNTGKDRTNEQLLLEWKSIQQTEFDVEIVKVKTPDGIFRENDVPYASIKLDEDGCLILKRK